MSDDAFHRWARRWHRVMALLMVVNLLLVGFNLSYTSLRGIYLRYVPTVVEFYDPFLGIEPHPVTQAYLQEVDQLRARVEQSGTASEAAAGGLEKLRLQSRELIQENPYLASGQMPLFAKLKRRIRGLTGATSAQQGFEQFWQLKGFSQQQWDQSIELFDGRIRPLLERNYYRETTEMGGYVNSFWRIDLLFMAIFGLEILVRTYILSKRRDAISWGDAIARCWYDLPLVLPFWQWMRVVPTAVRIHRSQMLNVERLLGQITHEPAAYLSDRVSKFVLVRLVNQTQESVKTGTLMADWQAPVRSYQAQQSSKLDRLSDRLLQLVVYRVLPKIKPDLEDLLRHSLQGALSRSELYGDIQQVPGLDAMPESALDALSNYLAQATCDVLAESYADEKGRVLVDQLSRDFRTAFGYELRNEETSAEIKQLLGDLLEELKRNYIQKADREDPESTLEEVDQLHQGTYG